MNKVDNSLDFFFLSPALSKNRHVLYSVERVFKRSAHFLMLYSILPSVNVERCNWWGDYLCQLRTCQTVQ